MITAVWGSPQSCKTTVAVELASALSQTDNTVCLISASDYSEMPLRFGIKLRPEQSISFAFQLPQQTIRNCAYEVCPNLFLLAPAATDSPLSLLCTGGQAEELITAAAAMFNEVIVDCTSWTPNALTGNAISHCDDLLITISSKSSAYLWHTANRQYLSQLKKRSHIVMCQTSETYDSERLLQMIGCGTPEATLPFIAEYQNQNYENSGTLILKDSPSGGAARQYRREMNRLVENLFFTEE